jgi:hypothetical protein
MRTKCPLCNNSMVKAFFVMSGGIWLSESRQRVQEFVDFFKRGKTKDLASSSVSPLRCVVGKSGFRADGQEYKRGLYCYECGAIVIDVRRAET